MNRKVRNGILTILFLILPTLIGGLLQILSISYINIVLVYILFVTLTARFTDGYIYGLFNSLASTLVFNYFFTEPVYTLRVNDLSLVITFVIMTIISFVTSMLTSELKDTIKVSKNNEDEIKKLYDLTIRNVNEIIEANEKVNNERYRSDLLRSISHDVRTPLTGILGNCEILLEKTKDNKEYAELVNNIMEDGNWLMSMVENILSLTKLTDEKLKIETSVVAIEELVEAAIGNIERRYKNASLNINIPQEVILVDVNPKLLVQVITNLIDNAYKFSDGKPIDIEVSRDENFAYTKIIDRGEGISAQDIKNVFDLFYTGKNPSSDKKIGTGIGLAICKNIIDNHKGRIEVRNNVDVGSTFMFSLPISKETNE